jgi:4-amino-4-deoxy-L-arabinose transferase-like glycosyltransferase
MATQTPSTTAPLRRPHEPETAPPRGADAPGRARRLVLAARARPELLVLVVVAGLLNLWGLGINGTANDYYSAAVRSMTQSWHAFLYGSFDASGVMTVDKPPLALWVQALSARIFGFNSWSLLVPQALMGVGAVALTYDLTRRVFGRAAGGAAGLTLALTPIAVAISRHNNPDALLILCSVAALWFLVRGLEDGRTRWLLWAGVMVGLGFETKMAAALTIVPGIVLAWLWVAPRGRAAAARGLAGFGAVAAVVGLAWPVLMWLTPAGSRPWISGTNDNSIWSLIFGYNGLGRLFGQSGGPAGTTGGTGAAGATGGGMTGAMPGGGGGGGGMGGVFGGDPGVLRLLNASLGGQAGWLIGAALVAGAGILVLSRLRRADPRTGWLIAMGGAFLATAVAFSRAEGIFHPYYVSLLAPFVAALAGAGVGTVLHGGLHGEARTLATRILGPALIAGGVATELVVVHQSATDMDWIAPVLVVGGLVAGVALAVGRGGGRVRAVAIAAVAALLLAAPGAWAVQTLGHATSSTFPAGGPADSGMGGGGPGGGRGGAGGMRGGAGGTPPGMPGAAGGATTGGTTSGSGTGLPPGTTSSPTAGGTAGSGSTGSGTGATTGGGTGTGGTTAGTTGGPGGTGGGGMFGGGMFGGDTQSLSAAVKYAAANGNGTVAVSSQSGAASSILSSGGTAKVVGIGGFSGSESAVTADWLAQEVESGHIRYVLAPSSSQGGGVRDGRVGATAVLAIVQKVGKEVTSVDGLYDLQGLASALRAAG